MLAMLDFAQIPRGGVSKRLKRALSGKKGFSVRQINVLGAPVLHITLQIEQDIKPRVLDRLLHSVYLFLRGAGVMNVCFTQNFPYSGSFSENGFKGQDLTRLYETLACQAVKQLPCAGRTVYFAAGRMNNAGLETLYALCGRFRYVMADVTADGGYFRDIRRRFGVSVIENPTPDQLLGADAAMFFYPGARRGIIKLSDDCIVYAVNDGALSGVGYKKRAVCADIALPNSKESEFAAGFPKAALTAYALSFMTLPSDYITLSELAVEETPVFQLDKA